MRTVFALMAVIAVPTMAQEVDGPDIIVVAAGQPIRIDAELLRVAQRRFALDRGELAPDATLRYELWRGDTRIGVRGIPLRLGDGTRTLPITVDGDGRFRLPPIPRGRWFLTGPAAAQPTTLRPVVMSEGTASDDRRLGDLRAQCRVALAMGRAKASLLSLPTIDPSDPARGCASAQVAYFYKAERPLATAMTGIKPLPLSPSARAYAAPLANKALGNAVRVKLAYR